MFPSGRASISGLRISQCKHFRAVTRSERRMSGRMLDVVVSRSRKLDQIEAVSEWIGHVSNTAIFADLYFAVERRPEAAQPFDYSSRLETMKSRCTGVQCRPKSRVTFVVPSSATAGRLARRKNGRLAPASSTQRGPSCRFCVSPSPPQ